jgi:regulator of sigma E protease
MDIFNFLVGNDALSAIIAFILVLIPAVLIHELGHFLAAKAVGITILEFGIGLPPRLVKLFTWRGTDYTLNVLPLGGFVRPLGEDMVRQMGDEALEQDRSEAHSRGIDKAVSVNEAKPIARIIFMAAGAFANFLMAFVIFVVIALIGIPEIVGGRVNVIYVDPDSALAEAGLQSNDLIEDVNGEKFANMNEFLAQLYASGDEPVTMTLRREGVDGPFTLTAAPDLTGNPETAPHPLVADVAEDSPASRAGLQAGDLVTAFNGEPVTTYQQLQAVTREHLEERVTLTVWRAGEELDVTLTPRANPPEGQGAMGILINAAIIAPEAGLAMADGQEQRVISAQPLGSAVQYSLNRIGFVMSTVASIPGDIIRGTAQPEELRLVSPLGIGQAGGLFLQESIEQDQPTIILEFIALISLALGLTNLLPIPALDGGRIMFVLLEVVRGRPIAPEREGMVHLVGLALLLSLMVVVLLNDIANPLTDLLR